MVILLYVHNSTQTLGTLHYTKYTQIDILDKPKD